MAEAVSSVLSLGKSAQPGKPPGPTRSRRDRGGVTAAAYYKSFAGIQRLINNIKSIDHQVIVDEPDMFKTETSHSAPAYTAVEKVKSKDGKPLLKKSTLRHSIWKVAHRLQGFEMRFALKTAVVTSLLAIPAWLSESKQWWQDYEAWLAVAVAWMMMHPRYDVPPHSPLDGIWILA